MQLSIWHTSNIYDDRVHVPLIFSGFSTPSDKVIPELTRSIDIFPTILDICNISNFSNRRGESLLPVMLNEDFTESSAFIESTVNLTKASDSNLIGLRTSKFKYFRSRNNESENIHLYDIDKDPLEENNTYLRNSEIIKKFESELMNIDKNKKFLMEEFSNEIELDEAEDIEKKLKEAGYIN